MAILRAPEHHQNQLTGIKGAIGAVETGLKWYGTLKGAWEVGQTLYRFRRSWRIRGMVTIISEHLLMRV